MTGVQTCALPISIITQAGWRAGRREGRQGGRGAVAQTRNLLGSSRAGSNPADNDPFLSRPTSHINCPNTTTMPFESHHSIKLGNIRLPGGGKKGKEGGEGGKKKKEEKRGEKRKKERKKEK